MPSARPSAAFEPISPDFDIKALVESTPNFEWVVRIQADMIDHQGIEAFEKLVLIHVILGGKPLVVEGYERRFDKWTFAVQWLRDNVGSKVERTRDQTKKANLPMTFAHYLNHMALLTNQWTNMNYKDPDRQRIYLKDIDCPSPWRDKLQDILPNFLFYLNNFTGDYSGSAAVDGPDSNGAGMNGSRGRGVAKAGDLMSCLPKEMRAENLMCYIGHEGTYTPAHREMCASLGQNIMVEASTGIVEDGKLTKPGSAIWFMTESKERAVVSEYWLSRLGHDIEVESHFAQINAWKNAPFKTYVVEQRPGDFILIPPLAPHQVWNRGTRTMKVAWNRTTVETLEMALDEALPRARMVCRDEQYKNKAIIYFTLQHYSRLLKSAHNIRRKLQSGKRESNDVKIRQLEKDFRRLHAMFGRILVSESFLPEQQEKPELIPFESYITCSYCRCNIFNRFLTCPSCVKPLEDGEEDTYDICMDCYAMGRSCACISKLKWVEQFTWSELTQRHEQWRVQILEYEDQTTDKSPMPLDVELKRMGRMRTLAQICQLELERRPWRDITKGPPIGQGIEREEEIELDINGKIKKRKKVRRSEKFVREHARCHVDKYWEPKWKQAQCSKCDKKYCYGTLFRAYDMMPQDIVADPDWKCPSCRNICSCRACSKRPGYQQYTPQGTVLGHNTKAVADPRSVESLVDFGYSNLAWIQKAGDDTEDNTRRLKKRRQEAEAAKALDPELDENYADEDERDDRTGAEAGILEAAEQEGIPIDPALMMQSQATSADDREDEYEENPEGRRQSPLASEYIVPVPAGGILRDRNHAYDLTEAITYDYPDPDFAANLPVSVEEEEPVQSSSGSVSNGHPAQILMVDRKRKRNTVERSKRRPSNKQRLKDLDVSPAGSTKASKKRQSLVVKLPIASQKLAEAMRLQMLAQGGLRDGTYAPAPVIGSDLQALNTEFPSEAVQPPLTKKARTEQGLVDRDDDFLPGRYRDRRKRAAHGTKLARPDTAITRRQTRKQTVAYEELESGEELDSGEEFEEIWADRPRRLLRSKPALFTEQATMTLSAISHPLRSTPTATAQPSRTPIPSAVARLGRHSPYVLTAYPSQSSASKKSPDAIARAEANRRAKIAAERLTEEQESEWSATEEEQTTDGPMAMRLLGHKESNGSRRPGLNSRAAVAAVIGIKTVDKLTPQLQEQAAGYDRVRSARPAYKASTVEWSHDSDSDSDMDELNFQMPSKTVTGSKLGSKRGTDNVVVERAEIRQPRQW
ncbi:hypothetical protein DV736_g5254, partial [Chaetothyriales sp. CBS 134916]